MVIITINKLNLICSINETGKYNELATFRFIQLPVRLWNGFYNR